MLKHKLNRRRFLQGAALGVAAVLAAACKPEVIVETVVKEVEKVVKETVVVEGEVQVVEKVVRETVIVEKEAEAPVGFQGTIGYHTRIPPQISTGPGVPTRMVPQVLANSWEVMHPGVKIEFTTAPGGQALTDWMNTQLVGGTGPDIFDVNPITQTIYVDQGKVLPLNDWMEMPNKYTDDPTPWKKTFRPPFEDSVTTRSVKGLYGCAPLAMVSTGIFCNVDMMAEVGIDLDTALDRDLSSPPTWAEWMDWHDAILDAGYEAMHDGGYGVKDWWGWGVLSDQLLWRYRESLDKLNYHDNLSMQSQETIVSLEEISHAYWCLDWDPWSEPEVLEMFYILKDWCSRMIQGFINVPASDAMDMFMTGNLAMIWNGSWAIQNLLTDNRRDFQFSSFWLPPVTKETSEYVQDPPILPIGIGGYGTNSLSLHHATTRRGNVEECIDWLMFLTEPKNNEMLMNEVPSMVPSQRKANALPEIQNLFVSIERGEPWGHQGHVVWSPPRWFGDQNWFPRFLRACDLYWLDEMSLEDTLVDIRALTESVAPDFLRSSSVQYTDGAEWDLTQWECNPDV